MSDLSILVDILLRFLPPMVGAFLGIPFGFLLNRWLDRRRRREEKKVILKMILTNLEKNTTIMKRVRDELAPGNSLIFDNLDMGIWPFINTKLSILDNNELFGEIFQLSYELNHLARKIDLQLDSPFLSGRPRYANHDIRESLVNEGIIAHIDELYPKIEALMERIKEELKKSR